MIDWGTRNRIKFLGLGLLLVSSNGSLADEGHPDHEDPLIEPECDLDENGVVDGVDFTTYDEDHQYVNMLNFYALSMSYTPLHSPVAAERLRFTPSLELAGVRQLDCIERAVFEGVKTEHTNRAPVFPRLRFVLGLPLGFYVGFGGIPPVPLFGVESTVYNGELGFSRLVRDRLEIGARAHVARAKVVGDIADALDEAEEVDDVFRAFVYGGEVAAGYRIAVAKVRLVPYLGAGYTGVIARMYVGEDGGLVPGGHEQLYTGPNFQFGLQVNANRWDLALEAYMVPLNLLTHTDGKFYFSPRMRTGFNF